MISQDNAQSPAPRRRPGPWRWLVFALIALIGAAWLALDMLPRLAGGLMGRGLELPGGSSGVNWDEVQVLWDTEPSGEESAAPIERPEEVAETAMDPESEMTEPESVDSGSEVASQEDAGGPPPPAGETAARQTPGRATPGMGDPTGEGRRSPRILYSEWPSRELLAELKSSGSLDFRLRVERDGQVSEWQLLAGNEFDCRPCLAEAERIIASLVFSPGTHKGKAVACWVPYRISFNTKRSER
jgi:hypothetical protein